MCNSCVTGWGACGCDGGSVFGVCPCQKGVECPICEHYPKSRYTGDPSEVLKELLLPEVYQKDKDAYQKTLKKE